MSCPTENELSLHADGEFTLNAAHEVPRTWPAVRAVASGASASRRSPRACAAPIQPRMSRDSRATRSIEFMPRPRAAHGCPRSRLRRCC